MRLLLTPVCFSFLPDHLHGLGGGEGAGHGAGPNVHAQVPCPEGLLALQVLGAACKSLCRETRLTPSRGEVCAVWVLCCETHLTPSRGGACAVCAHCETRLTASCGEVCSVWVHCETRLTASLPR